MKNSHHLLLLLVLLAACRDTVSLDEALSDQAYLLYNTRVINVQDGSLTPDPAMSLHEELVLFQEAGLSPLQILQSATLNGARWMERLDDLATVETGRIADLVLLNRNPLEDIRATQDIFAVVCRGRYLDRRALDALLQQARETKVALDSSRRE